MMKAGDSSEPSLSNYQFTLRHIIEDWYSRSLQTSHAVLTFFIFFSFPWKFLSCSIHGYMCIISPLLSTYYGLLSVPLLSLCTDFRNCQQHFVGKLTRQIHIEWQSKHNYFYVIYEVYIQTSQPTTCFGLFQLGHLQVGHKGQRKYPKMQNYH